MKYLTFIILFVLITACSQKQEEIVSEVQGDSLEQQMIEAYNSGLDALDKVRIA